MSITVTKQAFSTVPTAFGTFNVYIYSGIDRKEHVALIKGTVAGKEGLLVRIHSECFTGDVLGSRRCDCGDQLEKSLRIISREEAGILLYLRQEGRGIGLVSKLQAYNLQDMGLDTVDANVALGYRPDERDYGVAAAILKDLQVGSVRLLTNNPQKIDGLRKHGILVGGRVPVFGTVYPENKEYLITKLRRMSHLLDISGMHLPEGGAQRESRPRVTLCYAQSLDGCVAAASQQRLALSSRESLNFVHSLRAEHDGILVGIGTVIADDPRLTVRYGRGRNPRPVVLDSRLRLPPECYLVQRHPLRPWICAGEDAGRERQRTLEKSRVRVFRFPYSGEGFLSLPHVLRELKAQGIGRLMVEGGSQVITSFLAARLVDSIYVTIAPVLVGGLPAIGRSVREGNNYLPQLRNISSWWLGKDMVVQGEPAWESH